MTSRVEVYEAALRQGRAGDLCDRIVATHPVPPMLLATLRYRRITIDSSDGAARSLWRFRHPMPNILTRGNTNDC